MNPKKPTQLQVLKQLAYEVSSFRKQYDLRRSHQDYEELINNPYYNRMVQKAGRQAYIVQYSKPEAKQGFAKFEQLKDSMENI